MRRRIDGTLIVGGKYHDNDFARLELLKLLSADDRLRIEVGSSYRDVEAIRRSEFLVTYTCDVVPSDEEAAALRQFLERGGRWFALHGTNSVMEVVRAGERLAVKCPRNETLIDLLGSQFVAHPPVGPFTVSVAQPEHPLVRGIPEFTVTDELYLMDYGRDNEPLLWTTFSGTATGFERGEWTSPDPHLVFYIHRVGVGEVLYLTLGHCRGHWDMRPLMEEYPRVERGAWDSPHFHELLRRGITWAARTEQSGRSQGT